MRTPLRHAIFVLLSLLAASAVFGAADTQDQLQSMFDAGQYRQVLPELNTALSLKGPGAKAYDRYKLLILKGDTELHLGSATLAVDSFKAAALIAPDPDTAAVASATALLINRSSHGKFLPKKTASNTTPTAISIIEPADRKQAFAALFTELMDQAKPQLDRAKDIKTLPPLMELAKKLSEARPVEIASTGDDAQSKDAMQTLAKQAQALMKDALKKLDTETAAIAKAADKHVRAWRGKGRGGPEGLSVSAADQLQSCAQQEKEIDEAARQMQTVFGDAGDFKSVETQATKSLDKANQVLKKYGHATVPADNPPPRT